METSLPASSISSPQATNQQDLSTLSSAEILKSKGASKALIRIIQDIDRLSSENEMISATIKFIREIRMFVEQYSRDINLLFDYLIKIIPDENELRTVLWTKYFNVAVSLKPIICDNREEDKIKFDEFQEKVIKSFIRTQNSSLDQPQKEPDWRVIKKITQYQRLLEIPSILEETDSKIMVSQFKLKILQSLDFFIYHNPLPKMMSLAKTLLIKFLDFTYDPKNEEKLISSIIHGRFDKNILKEFNIKYSLILGEDGGLFALLNALEDTEIEELNEVLGADYLSDKIKRNEKNKNKIIIGKGSFGTVRFGLSLFVTSKTLPGELTCIKKTKNIDYFKKNLNLESEKLQTFEIINQIIDTTMGDYFATSDEITKMIYSAKVLDMSLNLSTSFIDLSHQKGYLMMEIVPQNTGTNVLIKNTGKIQLDWVSDIKPYILQVFRQTQSLLDNNIAMTDLKPDNTLYDIDKKRAFIIDLGGSQKIEEGVDKCKINKHDFQYTKAYTAPEFDEKSKIINLIQALSYTCGRILEDIITANKEQIVEFEALNSICQRMLLKDVQSRLSIEDSLKELSLIGDDKTKNEILFQRYILKVKDRLKNNRPSLSINQDIEEIRKLLIPSKVIKSDPNIIKDLPTEDLQDKFDEFFSATSSQEKIMVILGNAGSGKSVVLQLEFVKAIENWDQSKPLPIYFNLANGVNLDEVIKSLDFELNINLKDYLYDKTVKKDLILFIDSFDEGLFENDEEMQNLIQSYFIKLRSDLSASIKMIISCRIDFSKSIQNFEEIFKKALSIENSSFDLFFMTPFNYKGESKSESNKLQNTQEMMHKFYQKVMEIKTTLNKQFNFENLLNLIEYKKNTREFRILSSSLTEEEKKILKSEDFKKFLFSEQDKLKNEISGKNRTLGMLINEFLINSNQDKIRNRDYNYYLKLIETANIEEDITTGFIFHMLMKSYVYYDNLADSSGILRGNQIKSIIDIYRVYVEIWIEKSLAQNYLTTREQKISMLKQYELIELDEKELDDIYMQKMKSLLFEIGIHLATQLNINRDHRIKKAEEFFKLLDFDLKSNVDFKVQRIYFIIRNLPLKIEVKKSNEEKKNQEIAIGFIHDTIKNYFLLEALKREAQENKNSCSIILGARSIVEDSEFVSFLREGVLQNEQSFELLTNYLLNQIYLTKKDKTNHSLLISASNSMTILSAVKFNFIGKDLTKCIIKYANLNNGVFNYVVFEECDLSHTNMKNVKMQYGSFINSNLIGVKPLIRANLQGHKNAVTHLEYSPDGKYIVTTSYDFTAKIWDSSTSKLMKTLEGHENAIEYCTFSNDGKLIATGAWDTGIIVWRTDTGKKAKVFLGHKSTVNYLTFSKDGKYLASIGDTTCRIWEIASSQQLHVLRGRAPYTRVSFSPDGLHLGTSCSDGTAHIWETQSGKKIHELIGHTKDVTHISYSADGKHLVTSSFDSTCIIWDASSGKSVNTLTGHTREVTYLTFSPDGKYFATCSFDKTCKTWELSTGKEFQTMQGHSHYVSNITFSPNGNLLASCSYDATCRIWDFATGKQLQVLLGGSRGITYISFSPDGKYLAASSHDGICRVWDTSAAKFFQNFQGHSQPVTFMSMSPNGKHFATSSFDTTTKIWDMNSGKQLANFEGHSLKVTSNAFSSDGKLLATSSEDMSCKVWDLYSGALIKTLVGHSSSVTHVEFSPDGKHLVTSSFDSTSRVWDISSGQETLLLKDTHGVCRVRYSPNGDILATCSSTICKLWDPKTGKISHELNGHKMNITDCLFSRDGKYLATCSEDKSCLIWNVLTFEIIQKFKHKSEVTGVTFLQKNKYIATTSNDKICIIWEISSGEQIQHLSGHNSWLTNIISSPIGKYIITSSWDLTCKIWEMIEDNNSDEEFKFYIMTHEITTKSTPLDFYRTQFKNCKIDYQNYAVFGQNGAEFSNDIQIIEEESKDDFEAFKILTKDESSILVGISNQELRMKIPNLISKEELVKGLIQNILEPKSIKDEKI